jgi:hypothetical protein
VARLDALTITVTMPDHRPRDVALLRDVADVMPFGCEDLSAELHELADRIARMLLTTRVDASPAPPPPPAFVPRRQMWACPVCDTGNEVMPEAERCWRCSAPRPRA